MVPKVLSISKYTTIIVFSKRDNILVICAWYNCSYWNKNFFEKLLAESLWMDLLWFLPFAPLIFKWLQEYMVNVKTTPSI